MMVGFSAWMMGKLLEKAPLAATIIFFFGRDLELGSSRLRRHQSRVLDLR
jgi:hypothetical protein